MEPTHHLFRRSYQNLLFLALNECIYIQQEISLPAIRILNQPIRSRPITQHVRLSNQIQKAARNLDLTITIVVYRPHAAAREISTKFSVHFLDGERHRPSIP